MDLMHDTLSDKGFQMRDVLRAIPPFPTVFSKDLLCRHQGLFGKGLILLNSFVITMNSTIS